MGSKQFQIRDRGVCAAEDHIPKHEQQQGDIRRARLGIYFNSFSSSNIILRSSSNKKVPIVKVIVSSSRNEETAIHR